ncbi:TraR/DksA C4-type zinc finger protein [Priestia filamentosa]|uniref:TraR/DksA C4-type zinc finger protein n=1 Tax=Priestia filamentosa TaxID=1402861 RepID=UPI001FB3710F|nr:TraR/DksA C4-type zinc finger protein [Priestia filamentosa]MED3729050.1 TraR/DksA C4-type zinc finger protein [Priestia filamentosa]UOE58823.1 TraR/DksA C4-type zinc finger protein [Priestia filamentosa]
MLTSRQLSEFKNQLLERKKELSVHFEDNDHFNLQRSLRDSTAELSLYDNHPGDLATEEYEREKDVALNENFRAEYEGVERALEAISKGTYGICEVCQEQIPVERLEALPTARYCVEHAPDQFVSHGRPIEEDVLMPPFGQYDLDDKFENVAYDAEDSWQDASSYGTSESPADFYDPPEDYQNTYIESDENYGYVEDYENFVGVDIDGKNITIFPNKEHEEYENVLDEEGIMTEFGDLEPYEKDPYTEN